jgi:hypothetical protein
MSNLSKLTLTTTSPRQPITPLARKRIKLLQRLDQQIEAAEAFLRDEQFMEEIKRWIRDDDTGDKQLITKERPVRTWWWQNQHGAWMISLRDGNRLIPLGEDKTSAEVGNKADLVDVLSTLRDAVIVGELDKELETLISSRKPFGKKKGKVTAVKGS